MDERCELTDLYKDQCGHCLGHKDAEEQETEQLLQMVRSLQGDNGEVR
jgi:hypothetical protein